MDQPVLSVRERVERCRQAVEADPSSAIAHANLGTALLLQERVGEAEKELRRSLELGELPEALVNLGGILLARWDFRGCVEVNKRAAAARPEFLLAHYNQGLGHLYLGESREVVSCFERVVALEPAHPGGNYYLAVGLLAEGDVKRSHAHLYVAVRGGFSPQPDFLKALEKAEQGPPTLEIG